MALVVSMALVIVKRGDGDDVDVDCGGGDEHGAGDS